MNDAYWFNQMACSSPRFLFWLSDNEKYKKSSDIFWDKLSFLLNQSNKELEVIDSINKKVASDRIAIEMNNYKIFDYSNRLVTRVNLGNSLIKQDLMPGAGFFYECVINSLDEPYSDPSVVPSFILSNQISKYYKVAISGDGGDELLGGYKRTMDSLKSKSFINNIFSKFYNFYPPALGTGNKFLSQSSDINTRYRSYLEDMNLLKLLEITPSQRSEYVINIKAQYEDYKGLLLSDYRFYLPDMMMFKIDRTSMANSLEIRSPFVDHKLVEYIMSTKSSYINLNNSKNILKNYLSQDFSNDFLNRDKQGFVFDIENWIFQNLSMLNETLNTGKVSNYIPANFALKVAKYKSRINSHRIWKLFVLNHYLENLD